MYKNMLTTIVFFCIISTQAMGKNVEETTHPQLTWEVGDHWCIRNWKDVFTDYKSDPRDWKQPLAVTENIQCTVTGISKFANTTCWVLSVVYPKTEVGFQERFDVFYDRETGIAKGYLDVSMRPDGSLSDYKTPFSLDDGYPIVGDSILQWTILPIWSAPDKLSNEYATEDSSAQQLLPSGLDEGGNLLVVIQRIPAEGSQSKSIMMIQQWYEGEPWWRTCIIYVDNILKTKLMRLSEPGCSSAGEKSP